MVIFRFQSPGLEKGANWLCGARVWSQAGSLAIPLAQSRARGCIMLVQQRRLIMAAKTTKASKKKTASKSKKTTKVAAKAKAK